MNSLKNKKNFNINEIIEILPHRYPFILIDKIQINEPGISLTAMKNTTINEPYFQGHFPSKPIMPGVLIIEAMAQTAAILVSKTIKIVDHDFLVYFMTISNAKFRKLVQPGDVLKLKVLVERNRGNTWKFSGNAFVEENLVTEANFTAMMIDN